jgi:predicted Zn-dependent protease
MRLLLLLTFLYSLPVLSHQSSVTSSQKEIKWNYSNVPIKVLNNSTTLSSVSTANLIDQAIAEWNGASSFKIQKVSSSNNQIRFVSNFAMYGSAVVGVTEVNYNSSGVINTASILLNEENYNFTATPGMALGNNVYLKDVVTHELGHFVGLGHSEVLNSSMFYQNFPGQSELAADDKAGVKTKYGSGHGKISGHVQGGNHIGILGVHVQAISRKTGEIVAGISDVDGFFEIDGLDLNDTYYIYTSKLKNLSSLPSYFANVQTEYCPASYVGSFFSKCGREHDGMAQGISLTTSQKNIYVGEVSINCGLRIQADYVYEKLQTAFSSVEVFNYSSDPRMEKTHVGFFKPSELTTTGFTAGEKLTIDLSGYSLPSNKFLKIRLISQPLGNAVEYTMTVNSAASYGKTFNLEGTYKLDLVATEALSVIPSSNIFEVEIAAKKLSGFYASYSIPDFSTFGSVDDLPYLLVMSIETIAGPEIDTGLILSDNASCLDAPFTYTVQKSTANSDEESASKGAAAATCATIDPPSGPGSGPGQFLGVLCLGFLLSTLPSRLVKRHKKILS